MAVNQSLSVTEVSGSVNNTDNTSKVRIYWTSTQTGSSYNDYKKTAKYWVSINGEAETEYTASYRLPKEDTRVIVDTTITVPHKADGTGTVKVRTWMDTGISAGVIEKSTETTLTTIPRASTITSATDTILGDYCSVTWTPLSTTFRYKLLFWRGEYFAESEIIHPGSTAQYTHRVLLPLETANMLWDYHKSDARAILYTYSDAEATVQVGSSSSAQFEITVPDNADTKPAVSMTLAPVGSLPSAFDGVYIQGRTKVKATLSAEGKFSATIREYMMMVGGNEYRSADNYTSNYLSEIGVRTVNGYAKDSRGFWGVNSQEITVLSYSKPQLHPASDEREIICARCDEHGNLSSSGKYLKIKAKRHYSKVVSDGVQKNFCAIRYRFRSEEDTSFPEDGWVTILAKNDTSTDTIDTAPIKNVVSSAEKSYFIQIGVIDEMGESDAVTIPVPSDFTTIDIPKHLKGKRIGLLRYAKDTDEPGIDVGAPLYGGSVDSLKLGTLLSGTAEAHISLDDLTIPDCYYSPNAETTQYINGTPEGITFGFSLEVRELQSANNILQTLRYGITTWLRHWNGTEWSSWVCSHNTTSGTSASADFVVDSGTSGVWNYRLWNSGDAELWGVITLDTFGDVRHIYSNVGLPFPFTEYPTVGMTISRATAYSHTQGSIVLTEVYTLGESTIKLMMIKDDGGLASGNSAWVNVIIKGKWK